MKERVPAGVYGVEHRAPIEAESSCFNEQLFDVGGEQLLALFFARSPPGGDHGTHAGHDFQQSGANQLGHHFMGGVRIDLERLAQLAD